MNDSVERTDNQFQQNISVELTGNILETLSTEKFITFPVNLK